MRLRPEDVRVSTTVTKEKTKFDLVNLNLLCNQLILQNQNNKFKTYTITKYIIERWKRRKVYPFERYKNKHLKTYI